MKRTLVIAGWEFWRFLRTWRFWLATLFIPLLFTGILLLPSLYYQNTRANQSLVIGCVTFDTTDYYCRLLSERLFDELDPDKVPPLLIECIVPDTTETMLMDMLERRALNHAFDSLSAAYTKVQERRQYLYSRPESSTRSRLLKESYEELISTREQLDLTQEAYKRVNTELDTMVRHAALHKADSLLGQKRIAAYMVVDPPKFAGGEVDLHIRQPRNIGGLQPLEHALQVILVEQRLRNDGLQIDKIQEMLRPIRLKEILTEGSGRFPFSFIITYLAPLITLGFLLTAMITATGFLGHSIIEEKSRKIIEYLLSAGSTMQIVSGKVLGIWLLGMLQLLIWLAVVLLLLLLTVLLPDQILFLNWQNLGWFVLYFTLGYLFFGAFYVCAGALSSDEASANRSIRWLHGMLIAPVALVAYALFSPNALLARFLSYIPLLTPTFMVIRTPIDAPPVVDYYVTVVILLIGIFIGYGIAYKIFRLGNLSDVRGTLWHRLSILLQSR